MSEQNQENNSVDQPQRESTPSTFRERTLQRLDRGERSEEPAIVNQQEAVSDAHQPDDGYPDEELQSQEMQPTEDTNDGVDNTDVEDVFTDRDIPELRQRATEAEAMVESMQSDYTRKTQKLGESRRELLDNITTSQNIAKVYVDRANQQLNRYQNVNWQQLQSTLDPQTYNQRVNEYRQVVALRDRASQEHDQIANYATTQVERQKQQEAEISRDVLRTTVPGWGNELYGSLREHAVNALDFTNEEFDQITDHRFIKLIHATWKMSSAGKKIGNIQHNGNQSRSPSGPNKERVRGADGRFRQAQDNHQRNPGDRGATLTAFTERLRRERINRGR
jgi:hypothetical protein